VEAELAAEPATSNAQHSKLDKVKLDKAKLDAVKTENFLLR
jgi:hypothetical protein